MRAELPVKAAAGPTESSASRQTTLTAPHKQAPSAVRAPSHICGNCGSRRRGVPLAAIAHQHRAAAWPDQQNFNGRIKDRRSNFGIDQLLPQLKLFCFRKARCLLKELYSGPFLPLPARHSMNVRQRSASSSSGRTPFCIEPAYACTAKILRTYGQHVPCKGRPLEQCRLLICRRQHSSSQHLRGQATRQESAKRQIRPPDSHSPLKTRCFRNGIVYGQKRKPS